MARDVEADVQINDKSSKGLSSFLTGLRRADSETKKTQRGIEDFSKSTEKLSKGVDDNARAFSKLSGELEISKRELGGLAKAFADAGTAAERSDISKAMRKQQTEIRNLTKNRDILKDLLPSDDEAENDVKKIGGILTRGFRSVGPEAASSIGEALSSVGDTVGPVLAGVAVAAAPVIGATISAAIIGGAGLGGVVGGVLLAAQDSRVQAAFAGMKTRVGNELKDAAIPFISQTIAGIGDIENELGTINFKGIFANASTFVRPLARGIGSAIASIGAGLDKLIAGAGPVIDAISAGIAETGRAVEGIFASLSDNGVAAAAALHIAFGLVIVTLENVGAVINGLTETFGFLAQVGAFGSQMQLQYNAAKAAQDIAAKSAKDGTPSITDFAEAFKDSGTAAAGASSQIDAFTQSVDDAAGSGIGLYESQTNAAAALRTLNAGLKENGKTLDLSTEKGRANRTNLAGYARSLVNAYDGYVKLNHGGAAANAVLQTSRDRFIAAAQRAGETKKAAEALATQFGLLPTTKNVHIKTDADAAKDAINRVHTAIKALPHSKTVTINISIPAAQQRRVENTLARLGGGFDATQSFAVAGPGGGLQRSGGPAPVNVTSDVNSFLYLDGSLIYTNTARQVRASSKRDAWRQRVGKR